MKKVVIFCAMLSFAILSLAVAVHSGEDTVSKQEKSSGLAPKLRVEFEDGRLTAVIAGATLKEVVQELGSKTGAKFVLVGDKLAAEQAIFAQVFDEPWEKALARILQGYSYAVAPMRGSDTLKVTIVLEKGMGKPPSEAAPLVAGSLAESQPAAGTWPVAEADKANRAKSSSDTKTAAYVPHDLDEYMALPDETSMELESQQDTADGVQSATAQADLEERQRQARLERSLSALESEYGNLRAMAVEELTGIKDPAVTRALEGLATAGGAPFKERVRAAQALWHHAADLEFADSTANQALKRLASDSDVDPSVREIAKQAVADMEHYQRRYSR